MLIFYFVVLDFKRGIRALALLLQGQEELQKTIKTTLLKKSRKSRKTLCFIIDLFSIFIQQVHDRVEKIQNY